MSLVRIQSPRFPLKNIQKTTDNYSNMRIRAGKATPSFDISFYKKGVGDDPELLKTSLSNVEKSWNHYLVEIEKALKSNDAKSLHYWAHTLKGSLAFIKAEDGVNLAKALCDEVKKEDNGEKSQNQTKKTKSMNINY